MRVLEQREQFQEYLHLAKAEGQIRAYVTMLVRQGPVAEAISYGRQHLATAENAFALAQAMFTHGFTLEGNHVPLAIWLVGEQTKALEAGEIALRGEPTLKHYLPMTQIAGTCWPEQRAKLLDYVRLALWTADPQGLLRIFLSA